MQETKIQSAMLMAAGMGTRLKPFTEDQSKITLPVMGIPVAQFSIDSLMEHGVQQLVANVHHRSEQTQKTLLQLERKSSTLFISDESEQLLGSAGGIRKALHHFGSKPFFLANTDAICDVNWTALAQSHAYLNAQHGVTLTLALFPRSTTPGAYREICFDPATHLIHSLGEVQENRPFYIGAAIIEAKSLTHLPDGPLDFIPHILQPAITQRRAGVHLSNGLWLDVGSPASWQQAHFHLMDRLEYGGLTTQNGLIWKSRLEKINRRITNQIWVGRTPNTKKHPHSFSTVDWQGPAYWQGHLAPQQLGPRAILYGDLAHPNKDGIGFGKHWVNVPKPAELSSNSDLG